MLNGVSENLRITGGTGDATFNIATPGDMTRLRLSAVWRARDAQGRLGNAGQLRRRQDVHARRERQAPGRHQGRGPLPHRQRRPAGHEAGEGQVRRHAAEHDLPLRPAHRRRLQGAGRRVQAGEDHLRWDEAGQAKTHTHVAKSASETYSITAGAGAVVKSYTMELAE